MNRVDEIIREEAGSVALSDVLFGKGTLRVNARRRIARRLRDELKMSYPKIGKVFGGQHHTTIMGLLSELGWQKGKIK